MHLAALLLSMAVALQTSPPNITDNRVPDAELVARVEAAAVMPDGAAPLASYDRIYTRARIDGKDLLLGQLIHHSMMEEIARTQHLALPPPIRRGLMGDMLPVFDGGCGILTLIYEIGANSPPRLSCNGGPHANR
jgi:hypothetical protein